MTREQLINEAVAKALGWEEKEGLKQYINFHCDRNLIADHIFPEIEKRGLWWQFAGCIPDAEPDIDLPLTIAGYRDVALATPLQVCEAFLRATGNWTQEMEAE